MAIFIEKSKQGLQFLQSKIKEHHDEINKNFKEYNFKLIPQKDGDVLTIKASTIECDSDNNWLITGYGQGYIECMTLLSQYLSSIPNLPEKCKEENVEKPNIIVSPNMFR